MNIQEFRSKYPQYNDMSDIELADSFHGKYYADIPKDRFYKDFGVKGEEPERKLPAPIHYANEAGKAIGSTVGGFAAMPVAGITGLARTGYGLAKGEGWEGALQKGGEAIESVQGIVPVPKSETAQKIQGAINKPFEIVSHYAGEVPGNWALKHFENSPNFAAVVATVGEYGAYALLGMAAKGAKGSAVKLNAKFSKLLKEEKEKPGTHIKEDLAADPMLQMTPEEGAAIREAGTIKSGMEVADRIQRGYLGEEIKPKGIPEDFAADPVVADLSPAEIIAGRYSKYGTEVYDRIRRGYLGEEVQGESPKPFIAPMVEEYAGPRKPAPKQLTTGEKPKPAPPSEGKLFPDQKEAFRLIEDEVPPDVSTGEFRPATAEQPLLTGTEKAYRDVGMSEKPVTLNDTLHKEQVSSLGTYISGLEVGKRVIVDYTGEVKPGYGSTYPVWFKEIFPKDSAMDVTKAIRKWEKGEALGKKETRIMSQVHDMVKSMNSAGLDVVTESPLGNIRGSSMMITNAARSIKEFFSPLSTMPEGTLYKTLRYRDLLGGLSRVDRVINTLNKRYADLSIDMKKDVFNAVRGEIPVSTLPSDLQVIAKQTRADLNRVGEMLVKRGMLKKEVFEKNKDAYIHYLYLRHILPDGEAIKVGNGGKLDLSYLKKRKDLSEKTRKELGLIEDVSVAAPVGIGKALGDMVKADFFKKIAANPEWVWQPSKELAALAREHSAYKQIVERGDNVSPEVVAKYRQLEADLNAKSAAAGKAPADFVKLPEGKTYGDMAGAYVRKEIANDIVPIYSINPGELEGLARLWNKGGQAFDTGMTLFKVGKVALNPPTAARNAISGGIQMNMSGIGLHRMPDVLTDGIKSMQAKDKYYRIFERNGGFKTNFSVAELGEVMSKFERAKGGTGDKILGAIYDVSKYYGKIDDVYKMSLFKDAVTRQGMSVPDAVLYAHKWGMDYSLASRSVKHGRRYVLPFLSYQYKIAPLIAETMVKRPWILAKYFAIPYILSEYAASKYSWSDKDLDKAQKMMAEKTKGQGSYTLLPTKDNKGNIEIVNLQYFVPWSNYTEMAKDAAGGNYLDVLKQFGGIVGPYGNVITMLATKKEGAPPKDPFTGQNIYSPLDSPKNKFLKTMEWWYQLFGPSSMSSNGALGYTARAFAGAKDKWGTEATMGKALARWFGVNIGSLDHKAIMIARKARIKELNVEMIRIQSNPKYTAQEKKDAIRQLQIEQQKILKPE